jgi:exonuclease VII small subunit
VEVYVMSIQDDVFDVAAKLKGTEEEKHFERIVNRLWRYEDQLDQANAKFKILNDFIELVKEYTE